MRAEMALRTSARDGACGERGGGWTAQGRRGGPRGDKRAGRGGAGRAFGSWGIFGRENLGAAPPAGGCGGRGAEEKGLREAAPAAGGALAGAGERRPNVAGARRALAAPLSPRRRRSAGLVPAEAWCLAACWAWRRPQTFPTAPGGEGGEAERAAAPS